MTERVLVSGAGIAGCCAAWWLQRYGYDVTVVEQAPHPRDGGYVIDFWGLGYDVAEKMGVVEQLRRRDLDVVDFQIVDDRGRKVSGIDQSAFRGLAGGRIMSLQRSALALALYDAVKDRVTMRFGDSVNQLRNAPQGVEAQFQSGTTEAFDLVIGADGLHSTVRRLVFGQESQFENFLGYQVAAFSAVGYPHRNPHVYVTYGEPGRQIWRITLGNDLAVFLLVFADSDAAARPAHDVAAQKDFLRKHYAGGGWETGEMLAALAVTTDLYVDRVSQIHMPHWTSGRVALVGDACACPSLLAGEGSAMAMAEAYTVAGELHAAGGDYGRGFQAYEDRIRPYVERKQKGARSFASSFVPRTALGLWVRNVTINAMGQLGLTRLLFGAQFADPITLKTYQ